MTRFIVDIGSNHNQDINRAYALIDKAKEVGAWGCKFQHFKAEKLYHPSVKINAELKGKELPYEWIANLSGYAHAADIEFGMTFFHIGVMNTISPEVMDFIKISSFDTDRSDLIREALVCTEKRLIISTGLMTIEEIFVLNENLAMWEAQLSIPHKKITFMHCVSEYPANDPHMGFMRKMVQEGWPVGYSDHTVMPHAIIHAAILGAEYIEFHLDLEDGQGMENIGHCWKPKDIKGIIESVNKLDEFFTDKEITQKMLMNKADPGDGMRPIKRLRK